MSIEYVNLAEIKNSLELENLSYADADIRDAITAASRSIDSYCGRIFSSGSTTEVRYFTAYDPLYLETGDIVSVGTLATDFDLDGVYETTWAQGTDYVLEPSDAAAFSKPYTQIRGMGWNSPNRFPMWPNGVQVTGTFGWDSPPAEVKMATKIMAERFLRRVRDAPFGIINFGPDSVGSIASTDPDVAFLLNSYLTNNKVMAA